MAAGSIRVLLIDDHPVVRQGLRAFLDRAPDVSVVGEAAYGSKALELAHQLKPDVLLVDLVMPDMDGIELIEALRSRGLEAAIVVLTGFDDETKVLKALQLGVQGYILKDAEPMEILHAIRSAVVGRVYLHPAVARLVAQMVVSRELAGSKSAGSELTRREREILSYVAQGLKNKEIAARLFLSEATVKGHVSNILSKLGVADRVQAALWAVRHGLVGTPMSMP